MVVSSSCTSNALEFGFAHDKGSHVIRVPALASRIRLVVTDDLNNRFGDTFYQVGWGGCSRPHY